MSHHPAVNFKAISEKDSLWHDTNVESTNQLKKRVEKMKEFILSRKEKNIAIVSHSSYLSYFLYGKIDDIDSELKHSFPYQMNVKSKNTYI